ncbi:endonuclease/exonuclease/phosphatase family protein [Peptostreptococcus equinus]|uniref:Endonuclease n=1 Tax=Peptostreptococcus equinus TaxID=3003601 RepID=A0ABY7JLY4_9FIRM|nr:endonuclease/exonuclease/phosphatase family protein [Peptostreptococcus sp. CBA3647]WAW14364.1 endonuclease [Peptostreptococcus sp. CBA3647]
MSTRKKNFRGLRLWQKSLIVLVGIVAIIAISFAILIGYLHFTEFKPNKEMRLDINSKYNIQSIEMNKNLKVMTWNIGYGGLDKNTDFFMDGGKNVKAISKNSVKSNLYGISKEINNINPDFALLQEVDRNSSRSYGIDNLKEIKNNSNTWDYDSTFAYNYKVKYIPYPMPPLGKVNSGINTLSKYKIKDATRVKLPNPFTWPTRLANLKRCISINRIPIKSSDKELVLINLHLEAYDSGEGKKAQTAMLKEYLNKEIKKGNYVIAGGDFNQTFSDVNVSHFKKLKNVWQPPLLEQKEFDNNWEFLMDAKEPTCRSLDKPLSSLDPQKFQFYAIDGFIISKNIEINKLETKNLKFKNSDHNPVILDFKLK